MFEVGEWVAYNCPFENGYAIELTKLDATKGEWDGKTVIFSDLVPFRDRTFFEVREVIPPNPHKVHDVYRYVIRNTDKDGIWHDYLLTEVYLHGCFLG